jgi:SEC-C motif domain protein
MKSNVVVAVCPCGSGLSYARCCAPCHQGIPAGTAEQLVRSRYCAFVLGLSDYLLATWHPAHRPASLDLNEEPQPRWLELEVRCSEEDGVTATVEFVARYRISGKGQRLHEISRFVHENGRWFYCDGTFPDS